MPQNTDTMKKKRAAAISAVTAYIKSQEEAMAMAARSAVPVAPKPQTPWGISHRMEMMNLRSMMQMKAFHGPRFK